MNKATTVPFDPLAFLEKKRLEKTLDPLAVRSPEKTAPEKQFLNPFPIPGVVIEPKHEAAPYIAPLASVYLQLEAFTDELVLELLKNPDQLLKLNKTRRESLGRFLSELGRIPEPTDAEAALKSFTRIDRTEAEHEALKQLFKQIALVQVGKALLLKSWDKGLSNFSKADLKDVTAAIDRSLRPFINLQTSSCQLILQNFYSWYKLSAQFQDSLWDLLNEISDLDEAKEWILNKAITLSAETLGERDRYNKVFYQNLWKSIEKNKLFDPKSKTLYGFSPTLRDGCLIEYSPAQIEWMGFEPLCFELIFGEIRHIWERPKNLPLRVKGSGLEMSMEQQSSMPAITNSGKQNVLQQMDAISSCEIALITEESLIRTQGRSMAAQALRKQIDEHSVLKKIKQPNSTRGMYQACQSLEKLRQGGLLIWAREELLDEQSGKPALSYILNQAKILLIADFSALQADGHSIPKALYLLKKESNLEARKSHRPLMIRAFGALKNENDVSILFDRVMSLVQKPEQVFPPEPFQLHARVSPIDQREWEQHWFNPSDDQFVDRIEDLKRNATPLGQLAIIRTLHPSIDFNRTQEPDLFEQHSPVQNSGFYAWVESSKNGNEIYTANLDQLPDYMKKSHTLFLITPTQGEWNDPLQVLVRSQLTRDWFNYQVERKKGAWLLRESDLKSVPIPRHVSHFLMHPEQVEVSDAAKKILGQIAAEPGQAHRHLETFVEPDAPLKAHAFVLASQVLQNIEVNQGTLFSLVSPDEQIIFSKFFSTVFPEQDLQPVHQHGLIKFTPTLTPHMAISNISIMKFPTPGILLTTNRGLTQQLFIQDSWLRERCFEMMQEFQLQIAEPTWGELCAQIKLPKNPTQAQAMSIQILKAYANEKMRRKELTHLIGACLMNPVTSQSKTGLLQ